MAEKSLEVKLYKTDKCRELYTMALTRAELYVETPLIWSSPLSRMISDDVTQADVFLKMDFLQPTGSFKMRGVGYKAQQAVIGGCKHLVTASGGNAGLALTRAAALLKVPCTIHIPATTSDFVVKKLEDNGATVVKGGDNFFIANARAIEQSNAPGVSYVSPYDDPDVWTGNASLVSEIRRQLPVKPGVIIVSVGGGGLLCGVLQGLDEAGWSDVPVIAMETVGADCFNLSVKANKLVELKEITSIAVTLGAKSVAPHLMTQLSSHHVISDVITDAEVLTTCLKFSSDHRILVEPSCGAALSAIYCGILQRLVSERRVEVSRQRPAVVVVCGGSGVNIQQLQEWALKLGVPFPQGLSKNKL